MNQHDELAKQLDIKIAQQYEGLSSEGLAVRAVGFAEPSWLRLGLFGIETVTGFAVPLWQDDELVVRYCSERLGGALTVRSNVTADLIVNLILPTMEMIVRTHLRLAATVKNDLYRDLLVCEELEAGNPIVWQTWVGIHQAALDDLLGRGDD